MKNTFFLVTFLFCSFLSMAQVGIGTTTPQGALDVVSSNLGFVPPRVTSISNVTDGNGNRAADGTIVYDTSRQQTCFKIAGNWLCIKKNQDGTGSIDIESELYSQVSNYIKASNTGSDDSFGAQNAISLNHDGSRMAVGASNEDSNATGVNGDQTNNSNSTAGAVYIYSRSGNIWVQEAYIKASNTDANDRFGLSVSLNNDGSRLAVGAATESSNATGVNGDQTDNSALGSGAVYMFSRSGTTWTQEAYIKASNTDAGDQFGNVVSLNDDASSLVVAARYEDSNATGINGNQSDNSAAASGAVYVFNRSGTTWSQEAYIKASNTDANDNFGNSIDINNYGSRIVVGSFSEQSNAIGVNGNQNDNSLNAPGAVYVYTRIPPSWVQEAYIKASNTDANDRFGASVNLTGDATRLIVGAYSEGSNANGVNGNQNDNSAGGSGAAYIFFRSGTTWTQEAYIKASNSDAVDLFGINVKISDDGSIIAIGALNEDSNATGVNGDQTDNSADSSGALYVYQRTGTTWFFDAYIKASNTDAFDRFGLSLSLSGDGLFIAGGTSYEDSNATGINGDQTNNTAGGSGAVYIID